jgi:hypothetical protein
MTFSIAACCAFARAGIGAVATQNVTDPTLGPRALDLMALGATAMQALEVIRGSAPHIAYRQLAIIDAQGRTASFSGERTLGVHATAHGPDVVCAGNLLARENVPAAMAAAFSAAAGHPGRPAPGGHAGSGGRRWRGGAGALGRHAAGAPCRLAGGRSACRLGRGRPDRRAGTAVGDLPAQPDAYVTRALDPREAPSYGVPGDEQRLTSTKPARAEPRGNDAARFPLRCPVRAGGHRARHHPQPLLPGAALKRHGLPRPDGAGHHARHQGRGRLGRGLHRAGRAPPQLRDHALHRAAPMGRPRRPDARAHGRRRPRARRAGRNRALLQRHERAQPLQPRGADSPAHLPVATFTNEPRAWVLPGSAPSSGSSCP